MNTVTQRMLFRQSLIKYAQKRGVTKAAIRYNVSRQYIYRWKNRYDGTLSITGGSVPPSPLTSQSAYRR